MDYSGTCEKCGATGVTVTDKAVCVPCSNVIAERDAAACMQCGEPSTTTHQGTPVCNECLAYFLDKSERRRFDYTDSATANDMRFGTDGAE